MGSSFSESRRELFAGTVLLILVLAAVAWSRWPPPQLAADEDVLRTVDALFTALTSRDLDRLEDCERRLRTYRESGRLAEKPAQFLDGVMQQARADKWEPAAKRLYAFMYGQRGE